MYCPVCGQQQVSDATRFCSRCGFALAGIAQVVANNGAIPFMQPTTTKRQTSARRKGVLQGVFIMLCVLLVPVIAILHEAIGIPDILMPLIAVGAPILGVLRIVYALMFEGGESQVVPNAANSFGQNALTSEQNFAQNALPPRPTNFAATNIAYVPPANQGKAAPSDWYDRDTGKLAMPPSVTEDTTKLLDKNE